MASTRDWRELFRGEERHLDYKGAMAWDAAGKATLLKHIIAMSNIRDGGTIVIGVKENDTGGHEPESLTDEQLATFDPTPVLDYVNGYVQPGVRLQVCREDFDGHKVITLRIAEFDQSPNVCTRPGPSDAFRRGQILIRTNAAQSRAIENETEMNELLALALSKRSEALMRSVRQVMMGGVTDELATAKKKQDDGWANQEASVLARIHATRPASAMFGFRISPSVPLSLPAEDDQRFMLVQRASVNLAGYRHPWSPYEKPMTRAAFIEGIETMRGYEHEWRLYDDGTFLYWEALADEELNLAPDGVKSSGPFLVFSRACYKVALTLMFAQRLYTELHLDGELDIDLVWSHTKGRKLVFNQPQMWDPDNYECAEPSITESAHVGLVDLQSGWDSIAAKILARVMRLFQVRDAAGAISQQLEKVRKGQ